MIRLNLIVLIMLAWTNMCYAKSISMHLPPWLFDKAAHPEKFRGDIHVPLKDWRNFSMSQHHEDISAFETYFYGLHNGMVMETGCGEFSASLFFERVLNWKAIHIESDGMIFKRLKQNRPNQVSIHGALCASPQVVHFVPSQVQAAGIWEHMSSQLIDTWHQDLKNNPLKIGSLPEVYCVPINNLLAMLGITHIDLWLIDTDGTEIEILRGYNEKLVTIDVIAFQEERAVDNNHELENKAKCNVLVEKGYDCSRYSHDYRWCRRNGFVKNPS